MLDRQDVIRVIIDEVAADDIVVSNIADASFELYDLGDRARNFYMLGSFGLAPSIALGLALSRAENVIAINGDGSLLYNLGTLATENRHGPPNLVHVIVDNRIHSATGSQPTATAFGSDLAAMARGAGLSTTEVDSIEAFREALRRAIGQHEAPQVIVVRCGPLAGERSPVPALTGHEIRKRFMAALDDR